MESTSGSIVKLVTEKRPRYLGADRLLSPSLKLIGGKRGQRKRSLRSMIYDVIPRDSYLYLECFLGSGAVLVGKEPHPAEMVNDINEYVINFYHCLQENREALWESIQWAVKDFSAEKFTYLKVTLRNYTSDFVGNRFILAGIFYAITKHSNNGIWRMNSKGECNSTYCKTAVGRGLFDREWLEVLWKRIEKVSFYNLDYQPFIQLACSSVPSSCVYLDPPYYDVETKYWKEWKKEDHEKLLEFLYTIDSPWLLSYNKHPWIEDAYRRFEQRTVQTYWACSNTSKGRGPKQELFIANYELPDEIT